MKQIIASVSIVALTAMLVGSAVLAADTGQISATVTASVIAMTVDSGSVTYGTVATSADTTGASNQTQTLANVGTVNVDFEIKGYNSTGQVWTLGASGGDATYAHKTCISDCDGTPSWTAMTTGWADLATNVTALTGETALDLQVTVPTSNSGTGVATLPIDLLATAS